MVKFTEAIKDATMHMLCVRSIAEENNLLHTQEYIEFEDFMNKLSTFPPDQVFYQK